MNSYPFTILDIAGILNLKVRRRQPTNMDVDCPFCGHKKGKMNINFSKNVFRCNYCGESGGMIELYSKVFQISNAQAYGEICEILHCGKEAGELPQPKKNIHTGYGAATESGFGNKTPDLFYAALPVDFIQRPSGESFAQRFEYRADY